MKTTKDNNEEFNSTNNSNANNGRSISSPLSLGEGAGVRLFF